MDKPTIFHLPTAQEITDLETNGYVFELHEGKRIVGQAENNGYKVLFLEDGTDIVFDPSGNIATWPQEGGE